MAQEDKAYHWNRCWYIPFYVARLAAGPFLPVSPNSVEQHLELHPGFRHSVIDRYSAGIRLQRLGLAAAQVHGDSMIDRKIFNGDIAIFQRRDYYLETGRVVVIEKLGEEEGFGAWSLKKLVIRQPRSSRRNEFQDETDWDDPTIMLYSYNPRISPSQLAPSGQYRTHGIYFRCIPRHEAIFVDSDMIRRLVTGQE